MSFSKTVPKNKPDSKSTNRHNKCSTLTNNSFKPFKAKPLAKQEVIIPEDFIPTAINIQKFAIKENMKFINLGMRPQKLTLPKTQKHIEDVYGALGRLKPKKLYESIFNEHHLSKFIYDQFVTVPENSNLVKNQEKVLMNFIHSIESYKTESTHVMLFGQIISGIVAVEGVGFLIDLRGFIEQELNLTISKAINDFNMQLENIVINYTQLRSITDKVFGYGAYESRNEFLDTIKEAFPEINQNYTIPYELFLNHCVQRFCHAKHQQVRSLSREESAGVNLFHDKYDQYKAKTKKDVDIHIFDKLTKSCHRKMKDITHQFVDMILDHCQYKEKEEFEEAKGIISDLLVKKTDALVDSIITNNREMYFTLLTIDTPSDADMEYFQKLQDFHNKLVRFDVANSELLEHHEDREDYEEAEQAEEERKESLATFCKMFLTGQKITQEICRLIIY